MLHNCRIAALARSKLARAINCVLDFAALFKRKSIKTRVGILAHSQQPSSSRPSLPGSLKSQPIHFHLPSFLKLPVKLSSHYTAGMVAIWARMPQVQRPEFPRKSLIRLTFSAALNQPTSDLAFLDYVYFDLNLPSH